jgi:hypothetical protein
MQFLALGILALVTAVAVATPVALPNTKIESPVEMNEIVEPLNCCL